MQIFFFLFEDAFYFSSILIRMNPLQSHHHASSHHPLSQSTSPLSASCDCWSSGRNQLGWCCHMTQAWPVVRLHQPIGSSACRSQPPPPSTLTQTAAATSHSRPISVLRSQMSTTCQQQPSANQLKQEKSHSQPPSACHLITLQHLASPIQPILPTRPTVCLPFVISSLLKTKNTSKFSCFIQYTADYSFKSEETAGLKGLFFFFIIIILIISLSFCRPPFL